MRRLNQTGDTIVEVLIALTVVASMLGGAYVTSSKSLNNNRQAQERGEALKLAEAQLERLKSVVIGGSNTPYTFVNQFCIDGNNALQNATVPANRPDDFNAYQAPCTVQGGGPIYYVSVERTNTDRFVVSIRWDRVGGSGRDMVTLVYRVPSISFSGGVIG